MKSNILFAAMLLAAMGPVRTEPVHTDPVPPPAAAPAVRGAEAAAPPAPAAQRPALAIHTAAEAEPGRFLWQARPLVVFADSPEDPAFARQIAALQADPAPLLARDVVVIADTDPAAGSIWRRDLRPRGFSLVLLDKDGQVKQRKPVPWDVREITRAIDKFPLRRQETGRSGPVPGALP